MVLNRRYILLFLLVSSACQLNKEQTWIRVNLLGFYPDASKYAVIVSKDEIAPREFVLVDMDNNDEAYRSSQISSYGPYGPFEHSFRIDFSDFKKKGRYRIKAGEVMSPEFEISDNAYKGSADFLLRYMRQQRCGFNPFLEDSCHTKDGFIVYGGERDSTYINVMGGWHDATDYLQYVATSAHATYNMLFAYQQNPDIFGDKYQANGLPGNNKMADVLDEAKWGLDWLLKMNPESDVMFNQIADDRDHAGFRLPNLDSVDYGMGRMRPVYMCTGEVQGAFEYQNRTTGIASTAGKYATAFGKGYKVFKDIKADFAQPLNEKAFGAYHYGRENPGYCQTAPGKAPYFYEEENWADDMELAAAVMYEITDSIIFADDMIDYGKLEPVTPWLKADTARHYQWYPFVNYGHYEAAKNLAGEFRNEMYNYYKEGIEAVTSKADNAFLRGVPFIWCSNNLTASFAIQCWLYRDLTGDDSFLEYETAAFDWLFGCNPWGTSMVVGLPSDAEYPEDVHSSLSHLHNYPLDGGLVDGPVSGYIYDGLIGLDLFEEDEFAPFQSKMAVYHDDVGDYSTNEPTMDGTAILIALMALWER